jgi:hypothetical protein
MRGWATTVAVAVTLMSASAGAVDVPASIDAAKASFQKGDIARAARQLEVALIDLQDRLGRALSEDMPPALPGWQADDAETEGLGAAGGGLSVTRAYTKADASLNASIILDSPAVEGATALLNNQAAQPNLRRVKVGNDDAMLRWDSPAKAGEITMVLGGRVVLQIEGDNITSGDILVDMAKGFNVAAIRKLVGL